MSLLDDMKNERDLWRIEAEKWRSMYMEYDEMLEGDIEKVRCRVSKVMNEIEKLKNTN